MVAGRGLAGSERKIESHGHAIGGRRSQETALVAFPDADRSPHVGARSGSFEDHDVAPWIRVPHRPARAAVPIVFARARGQAIAANLVPDDADQAAFKERRQEHSRVVRLGVTRRWASRQVGWYSIDGIALISRCCWTTGRAKCDRSPFQGSAFARAWCRHWSTVRTRCRGSGARPGNAGSVCAESPTR